MLQPRTGYAQFCLCFSQFFQFSQGVRTAVFIIICFQLQSNLWSAQMPRWDGGRASDRAPIAFYWTLFIEIVCYVLNYFDSILDCFFIIIHFLLTCFYT